MVGPISSTETKNLLTSAFTRRHDVPMQDFSGWKIGNFLFEGDFAELAAKTFASEMALRHGVTVDVMTKDPLGDVGFMYQQNGVPDDIVFAAFVATLHQMVGNTKIRSRKVNSEYMFSPDKDDLAHLSLRSRPSSRRATSP